MTHATPYASLRYFAAVAAGMAALVLLCGLSWLPAQAADRPSPPGPAKVAGMSRVPPFARSERAQAVWAAGACWSECGSYCAWGQAGCLERNEQGQCLKLADACDRYCQRNCRTSGGPLLPLDF